ncbi:MAG: hypothetical protein KKB00_03075, partial [Gammaproteobacteria bacterium]|nr:hypothetical protein [Gammaproteobacteria bacterium]
MPSMVVSQSSFFSKSRVVSKRLSWLWLFSVALLAGPVAAEFIQPDPYARPEAALDMLVDLPKPQKSQLSPNEQWLLLSQPIGRPSIAQLKADAAVVVGLAGIAIDTQRRLLTTESRFSSFSLQSTTSSQQIYQVNAPEGGFLLAPKFS